MSELKYTFMNDTLFKSLFVQHPELLKTLVAPILGIQVASMEKFEIRNTDTPPESLGDKFCRLDINMEVDGQRVDLEIQQSKEGGFYPERMLYYWAREFSSALSESEKYATLPRTVHISFVGFNQYPCKEYHSEFQTLEVTRNTPLTDKLVIHLFELPKIPETAEADDILMLWLSLFNAKTEEDLERLARMEVPEMSEAISAYHHITVTPEFKEMERLRSKARHDEASALYGARQEGRQEGMFDVAAKMLKRNRPIAEIIEDTGLSRKDVESLRN